MAFSINDFFRGRPAQAASPQAQQAGVQVEKPMSLQQPNADPNKIAQQLPGTSGNGTANPTDPAAPPISPLDVHKDIWNTPQLKDGQQPVDPFAQPLLSTDPAKLTEAARKMNFAQGIDPALVQKALSGDPQALLTAINTASQNAFLAASQLTTQVTEGAVTANNKRVDSVLENKFKEYLVQQQRSDNPVLQHPAAAPMLDLAKKQLMQTHPDKSPTEIHRMAEGFLSDFASTLTTAKTNTAASKNGVADPSDFSGW